MLKTIIDPALVAELERKFPPVRPRPGQSLDSIFEYSGTVGLVEYLRDCMTRQQRDMFNPDATLFYRKEGDI